MSSAFSRVLGVGLATALSAITIALALTGRIGLYINPDAAWFAVSMAVLCLIGCAAAFVLPLGAEAHHDHGHDTGAFESDDHDPLAAGHGHTHGERVTPAVAIGGVFATGVVLVMLATPPTALSAEIAMSRSTGAPPLFQGADIVTLAATGDTESFGVGEWSSAFATATNPDAFTGVSVKLTGFVTPGDDGFALTRMVVTHCVIDAQTATVPVRADETPETGQWVEVVGSVREVDGRLVVSAETVTPIVEPEDPYEY